MDPVAPTSVPFAWANEPGMSVEVQRVGDDVRVSVLDIDGRVMTATLPAHRWAYLVESAHEVPHA